MRDKIQHPEFLFKDITHAFLTANIIGSTHKYLSNIDSEINHDDEILLNRKLASIKFIGQEKPINLVRQIHSNKAIKLFKNIEYNQEPYADAIVTDQEGIICATYTADCVPILFADPKNKVIGAAHAGWKGAKNGIIEATINKMKDLGAEEIYALIGPCIQQQSYQVSKEFKDEFLKEDIKNDIFFIDTQQENYYLFNLPGFVTDKLNINVQVKAVLNVHEDTLSNPTDFFSYRRNTINNINKKQFLISLIQIDQNA